MITREETRQLKGMAILAMLSLHLFDTLNQGFEPLLYITGVPVTYFIGHAADFGVMAYCFISGYALMAQYDVIGDKKQYMKGRWKSLE